MAPIRSTDRQNLPTWLWNVLESERCPGVRWVSRAQTTFKIPWFNQKTAEWKEEHSQLFIEYAIHTGKHQPGAKVDYPTFKQNFKSAIEKSKGLERLDEKSDKNYYRLYRFKKDFSSKREQDTGSQSAGHISCSSDECDHGHDQSCHVVSSLTSSGQECLATSQMENESLQIDYLEDPTSVPMMADSETKTANVSQKLALQLLENQETVIEKSIAAQLQSLDLSQISPSIVAIGTQIQITTVDSTTSNCSAIDVNRLHSHAGGDTSQFLSIDYRSPCFMNVSTQGHVSTMAACSDMRHLQDSKNTCQQFTDENKETTQNNRGNTNSAAAAVGEQPLASGQTPNLMTIQIIYAQPQRVVHAEQITANKCKIFFGKINNRRLEEEVRRRDGDAFMVVLPDVTQLNFTEENKTRILKTLETMELGIVLTYKNDDIFVVRRCQSRVYLSDGMTSSEPLTRSSMKEPEKAFKAFDFTSFQNSIARFREKKGDIDRDHFVLTIGCDILKNDPNPSRVVPIRIDVSHAKASELRYKELGPAAFVPDPQRSISDSFDDQIHVSNLPL